MTQQANVLETKIRNAINWSTVWADLFWNSGARLSSLTMSSKISPTTGSASSSVTALSVPTRAHLEQFFAKIDPVRGRIIFALDATASRQSTWDTAAQLQANMFETVADLGGLDIQLVFYRGFGECTASRWMNNAASLKAAMSRILCAAGHTQIHKVLAHARKENAREKVNALILISDACEEIPADLYAEARELGGVPVFLFQEGPDDRIAGIYGEIATITGGAHCRFDANAAQRLADLLKAVAAFATGGIKALAAQKTDAATLMLTQIKK